MIDNHAYHFEDYNFCSMVALNYLFVIVWYIIYLLVFLDFHVLFVANFEIIKWYKIDFEENEKER